MRESSSLVAYSLAFRRQPDHLRDKRAIGRALQFARLTAVVAAELLRNCCGWMD